jgi:hypothetical protein
MGWGGSRITVGREAIDLSQTYSQAIEITDLAIY